VKPGRTAEKMKTIHVERKGIPESCPKAAAMPKLPGGSSGAEVVFNPLR
jgi:hypothetical protein